MADEADDLIERFWSNVDRMGFFCRRPSWRAQPDIKCKFCGATGGLRWREVDGSWQLQEKEHPGNRYVQHVCQTSADGFEDEPL